MAKAPFTLDTTALNDEMQALAEKELRETPEIREKAIVDLRRLLQGATDLNYRDDDDFLLIFLRPCHFYPESALKMVNPSIIKCAFVTRQVFSVTSFCLSPRDFVPGHGNELVSNECECNEVSSKFDNISIEVFLFKFKH